jgi:exoribonuclease R
MCPLLYKEGTDLEEERLLKRATSVYLVDRCVPITGDIK